MRVSDAELARTLSEFVDDSGNLSRRIWRLASDLRDAREEIGRLTENLTACQTLSCQRANEIERLQNSQQRMAEERDWFAAELARYRRMVEAGLAVELDRGDSDYHLGKNCGTDAVQSAMRAAGEEKQ